MNKILIIEDDLEINALLADFLKEKGYAVHCQYDGLHVLDFLNKEKIDLIILDIMLPYRSGDIILSDVRKKFTIPVIIISAKETTQNKIDLLRLGADDYITKPFSISEMVARVKTHISRYKTLRSGSDAVKPEIIEIRGLKVDKGSRRVFSDGKEVIMTVKEYDLLLFLLENPNIVFNKEVLFDRVWGLEAFGDASTVTVHIQRIRDKIEKNSENKYIETVWGAGYRFRA